LVAGCRDERAPVSPDNPELSAFIHILTPAKIEIQKYLTKPVSFAGNGDADGLEAIIEARDSFDDPVKVVGTFNFELSKMRRASGDKVGERVAFWTVKIDSPELIRQYWDGLARKYRFPLQLDQAPLPPGRYILNVRLLFPTGEKLMDEYEFAHEAGVAPSVRPG
jgi:hypothetical protein